ncbi:MAG: diacylglycerol kinase family protein [Myxococcales bacterium]|nr:diacylglycerol kinase family protein [Myxococcales bacterium]
MPVPQPLGPTGARRPDAVPPYPTRRGASFLGSFVHAWDGILHTVIHQRNMRIHLVCAILVGLVGSGIPLGLAEKVTLVFCVQLVFFAEILNAALEQLVDLAVQQFDERARVVKDAAAAGVLVLAIGTFITFAAILVYNWPTVVAHAPEVRRQFARGIPLATLTSFLLAGWKKPLLVDGLLLLGALGLFAATLPTSQSYVFSTMTLGLIVVAGAAAWTRRYPPRAPSV